MHEKSEQRRAPRVTYRSRARLSAPERGARERDDQMEAEVLNLSASGMLVSSQQIPGAGHRLNCRVFLGTEPWILKGKVAWVRPDITPDGRAARAAGIEFVDLSREDSDALARAVGETRPLRDDELIPVEVDFEGLPAPVKARARLGESGVVVSTRLPFLRLGSEVTVRYQDGARPRVVRGHLEGISLGPSLDDDVPRLLAGVALVAAEPGGAYEEELSFPAVVLPSEMLQDDSTTNPEAQSTRPYPPLLASDTPTPVVPPSQAALFASAPAEPVLEARAESSSEAMVALLGPPSTAVTPPLHPLYDPDTEPMPHRWRRHFLISGAVLAGSLGFFALRAPSPVATRSIKTALPVRRPTVAALPHVVPLPTPAPANPVPAVTPLEAPQPLAVATPVVDGPAAARLAPGAPRAAAAARHFSLNTSDGITTVTIPVLGADGAKIYRLPDPPGMAAIMPHGSVPAEALGHFIVGRGGVRQVWIERRDNGLHLRVLNTSDVRRHDATLQGDALVFELQR